MQWTRDLLNPQYRAATRTALKVQVPVAILCLLVLDGGWTARICGGAMLGFWLAAALIASRRPWSPSPADLWFWRWGFLPCFALAIAVANLLPAA
jgi:hypothetical protein